MRPIEGPLSPQPETGLPVTEVVWGAVSVVGG
jgi:hypothetical protein